MHNVWVSKYIELYCGFIVEVVTTFRNMCFAYALEFQVEKNGDSFLDRIC
jgi:hypothetical protein